MIFQSENYIEGVVRGFFEKFFVADSNQIAVSYCIGSVSGIVKVPAIEPIFCCGSQKYDFLVFCDFL
jgi:hypothetical protein